jgi:WD40 repeat protein
VKLWRTKDGSNVTTLARHSEKVNSVVFSRDGQAIVSGSSDGTMIVWDLQQILKLDPLVYACNWVRDYLQTNIEVDKSDRNNLCP